MSKLITLNLTEEELVLLAGIIGYSSGDVLTNVYQVLMDRMKPELEAKANEVSRQIAITANGYYINEEDLMYLVFRNK